MLSPSFGLSASRRPAPASRHAHGAARGGTGRGLRLLCAGAALGGLSQSLAGVPGSLVVRQVAGSEVVAGLPQATMVVGSAVAAIVISSLTTRTGRGPALGAGLVAAIGGCAAATAGVAAPSLALVLVGSALLGAGNAAVMLCRYAGAELVDDRSAARAMGMVLAATSVGAVAGPNLLAPAAGLASATGLPTLAGPYVVSAVGFAGAALTLTRGLPASRRTALRFARPAVPSSARPSARPPVGPSVGRARMTQVHRLGFGVLAVANAVMVSVMTVLPLQLTHRGGGLRAIGVLTSIHIAAMFAPSPASAVLAARIGAARCAAAAGVVLVLACCVAVVGAGHIAMLGIAMTSVGVGWNLALVSGSLLLTAGVPTAERPAREARGEIGMGVAAAAGGGASGVVMATSGYPALAGGAAVVAGLLLVAGLGRRQPPVRAAPAPLVTTPGGARPPGGSPHPGHRSPPELAGR